MSVDSKAVLMPQSAEGWSVDTLRQHMDLRLHDMDLRYEQRFQASQQALGVALASLEKAMQAALTAADRAVSKAETAAEKRFDSVNEFRGLVGDQQRTLMPRAEAEMAFAGHDRRLDAVEKAVATRSGIHAGWGYAVGAIGLFVAIIAMFMRKG